MSKKDAESNLACIADALNTIARETHQYEEFDYLGPCVMRDMIDRLFYNIVAENKKYHDALKEIAYPTMGQRDYPINIARGALGL